MCGRRASKSLGGRLGAHTRPPEDEPARRVQGKAKLTGAQAAVAAAVRASLQAAAAGTPFDAMAALAPAVEHVPSSEERAHGRVRDLWDILKVQRARLQDAGGAPAGSRQRDMLRGSVEHLEAAYYEHVLQRVRGERQAARSGGSGSAESVLAGFVNASASAAGADVATRAWLQVRHRRLP